MTSDELAELLRRISPFYYWPNNGNLGDLLIAEATRQFFRKHHLEYKEFTPDCPPQESSYHLVYGGGGRFTPHWGGLEKFTERMTAASIRSCVILPHSISGVDDFVRTFDARHTIITRTQHTYSYCKELNAHARVELADDMALQMDVSALPSADEAAKALPAGMYTDTLRRMQCAGASIPRTDRRVTFILRTDAERCARYSSPLSYDLSLLLRDSDCKAHPENGAWMRLFADALRACDIVVTDRLHVAIMAHLVGREVWMLDNDYGKLSGVYQQSLANAPDVHLLEDGQLTPELEAAWKRLNSPMRLFCHKAKGTIRCILGKLRRLAGAIRRRF